MKKIKNVLLLPATVLFLGGCVGELANNTNSSSLFRKTNREITSGANIKVKNLTNDPEDPSKVGALLYAYDSNATYAFNGNYSNEFNIVSKTVSNTLGKKDLKSYSIVFKETNTEEQFAIKIFNSLNFSSVGVVYNGETAGVNYYETPWSIGQHYGYTGIANNEGIYTKVDNTQPIDILFNNEDLTVSTKLNDGNYHLVWDFKEEYNDGKYLKTNIKSFDNYKVMIKFDDVSNNGCANLMLYSFGNLDLSKNSIETENPTINPNIVLKAIAGKPYKFPAPSLEGLNVSASKEQINISVYDSKGQELTVSNGSFTPTRVGNYYAYYTLESDSSIFNYALIEAIDGQTQYVTFSEVELPTNIGQGKKVLIPDVQISSNLGNKRVSFDCVVTIKKDGNIISGYESVKTNFEYQFNQKGTYTIIYSNPNFDNTFSKSLVVGGGLAINEKDDTYFVGDLFKAPNVEFYKSGNLVSYTTTIISPLGETMPEEFKITQEGIYEVRYKLKTELTPYIKQVYVYKKNSQLFNLDSAEYGKMVTNNQVTGIKLPLKNNEEVTYKNVINLNNYKYDPSKTNPMDNPEILRIYAQPHNRQTPDAEAFFIKLTDAHDESNFLTIRLKYLNYFPSGCMVRARASNQAAFVGYYYNFASTAISVDNAVEHEEGGFCSFFNFASNCTGDQFEETTGFSLFFNNESNRLYSRPAWLTGHDETGQHPEYDTTLAPWLVYDFMTDDSTLSGGNTPWGGFTTGEVYLSIYAKGVASTADLFVTTIDGIDFNKERFDDSTAPIINVDEKEFVKDSLSGNTLPPVGEVNKEYKIFDFTAQDEQSKVSSQSVSVKDPDGDNVEVNENKFIPTKTGNYTITYEAKDIFNNVAQKQVNVTVVSETTSLSASLTGDVPVSIRYGDTITLPSLVVSGGSGNAKINVKVVGSDGNEVRLNKLSFKALNTSNSYNVTYTCTDYVGNKVEIIKQIEVVRSNDILFDQSSLVIPSSLINYTDLNFGKYVGEFYDSEFNKHEINAKIIVTDSKGAHDVSASRVYTPMLNGSENVSVKILFEYQTYNLLIEKTVYVKEPDIGYSTFTSSYFNFTNATLSPNLTGIGLVPTTSGDVLFDFIKPINCQDLIFDMKLNTEKISMTNFVAYLKDSQNSKQVVKFTYSYEYVESLGGYKLFVSVNDSNEKFITNIGSQSIFRLEYRKSNFNIYDSTGSKVCKLETFLDGSDFTGFDSNKVYFSFEIHDAVENEFEAEIRKINNQTLNQTDNDYQNPKLFLEGEIYPHVMQGSTMIIPKASCYDVLNEIDELTVSVYKMVKNGNQDQKVYVLNSSPTNVEYEITFEDYSKYYVEYKAKDTNGNTFTSVYTITVDDPVKAELVFSKDMPTTVKANSTLSLPNYTIVDNDDISKATVKIYIYTPDGLIKEVKNNKVNIGGKGIYVLTYTVIDSNGNMTFYSFEIVAK